MIRKQFMACWALALFLCGAAAWAAPVPWVLALGAAQGEKPLVLVVEERGGKLHGDAYASAAVGTPLAVDVTKLARTDTTLKGDVTVTLAEGKTGAYALDAAIKDGAVTGAYTGTTGDEKVTGAIRSGADLLPLGHALFLPSAVHPVGWRGDGSGRYPGATPVVTWDLKTQKNVVWQVKMPFFSCAGPIVVGDKVFTTGEPDLLICVDAKTGKELWRRHNAIFMEQIEEKERERLYMVCEDLLEIAEKWMRNPGEHEGKPNGDIGDPCNMLWVPTGDGRKTQLEASVKLAAAKLDIDLDKVRAMYAEVGSGPKGAPTKLPKGQALLNSRCYSWTGNMPATPASDGTHVIVRIASENSWGYLVCYDLDGNRKWSVDTGRTADWGCPYDSPLIIDGKAISLTKKPGDKTKSVQLSAFDIETGKPLWSLPTRANCASPVGLRLEGVPLICHDGSVYATADGAVLGSMKMQGAQKLSTFCSPSIDGDLILNTIAGRNAVPVIHRLSWTEKGKAIAYEEVFRGINGDGGGMPFSWDRGSPVLSDGWIFKSNSKSDPAPVLFAYNSKVPFQQSEARKCNIRGTNPVRPRPKKGEVAPLFGPPSEDDMSMVMGGQYLYAAPSHWPSQFVVVSAPPELKVVGEPVMDAALMGSPYFQGNRIYMRDYRYLYCFGEVPAVDQAPKGVN